MDLVVSLAAADVEVSIDAVHESATLHDVLVQLLPSPPDVVFVDGRPTPSKTLIAAAGLLNGSTIAMRPEPATATAPVVSLVQSAGDGGGHRSPLEPGQYVVGSSRRPNAPALTRADVLVPRFRLSVDAEGGVSVAAEHGDLDGAPLTSPVPWSDQQLRIGNRVFRLEGQVVDETSAAARPHRGQLAVGRGANEAVLTADDAGAVAPGRRGRASDRRSRVGALLAPAAQLARADVRRLDVAEVVRRAVRRSSHLWERSAADDDAFTFSVGLADSTVRHPGGQTLTVPAAPVTIDLAGERGLAMVGSPTQARWLTRALLLQACVEHSPAELDIVVLTDPARAERWEWVKWLPHARSSQGVQLLSDSDAIDDWVNAQRTLTAAVAAAQGLDQSSAPSRLTLAVIDDPVLWRGRTAVLQGLFAATHLPMRFVALTDVAAEVPPVCSTIMSIDGNGMAEVRRLLTGVTTRGVVPFGLDSELAATAARRLSPLVEVGATVSDRAMLPTQLSLATLVDAEGIDGERLAFRWSRGRRSRRLSCPLGAGADGTVKIDLVDDGPNVLIVGAPRSGKTETLCTILAALALSTGPDSLTMVTVEASPAATFDDLAVLPHMVGRIDQFNERRGGRLLRSLHAEVTRRAELLHERRVASIAELNAKVDDVSLSRLVIAVDDADVIQARSPAFMTRLIEMVEGAAHLGVHLLLSSEQFSKQMQATVKGLPGARVALRLLEPSEAIDLVATREPLQISVNVPGRAVVATRSAGARTVQVASVAAQPAGLVAMAPFVVARGLNSAERRLAAARTGAGAALTRAAWFRLIREAATHAALLSGVDHVPQVLCPELPTMVTLSDVQARVSQPTHDVAGGVPIGLADFPDQQSIGEYRWDPAADGNLAVIGGTVEERSAVLTTLTVAVATRYSPRDVLTYVVDAGTRHPGEPGALEAAAAMRNCAASASLDDPDRVIRLLGQVAAEVERRSMLEDTAELPQLVLLVNELGSLLRDFDLAGDADLVHGLLDSITEIGPAWGVTAVIAAAGESGPSAAVLHSFPRRVVLSLDDPSEYRALDIEWMRVPSSVSGRAIRLPDKVEVQIATVGEAALPEVLPDDQVPGAALVPRTPTVIPRSELMEFAGRDAAAWRVPVGLHAYTLQPQLLTMPVGTAALIVGEARTGKSHVLETIARGMLAVAGSVPVVAIASVRTALLGLSGLAGSATVAELGRLVDQVLAQPAREQVVLVDDTDLPDDPALHRLAAATGGNITLVVAGRARDLDDSAHWTAPLRRFRTGALIRPLAGDGAVFGLQISTSSAQVRSERALLVQDGVLTPVLLANSDAEVGVAQ